MIDTIGLTGASGMLGRHVAHFFAQKKIKVFATSRHPVPFRNKYIYWKKMDLAKLKNPKSLNKFFGKTKVIVHAGAFVPKHLNLNNKRKIIKTNIKPTFIISNWAIKNNIHFIYISGAIIYKNKNIIKSSEISNLESTNKLMDYGLDKKICDDYLNKQIKKGALITILRPSSIYGWGLHKSKIINKIIKYSKSGKIIKLSQPFEKINFIHAKDIANAIFKSIKKKEYKCFNLGSLKCYSIEDLSKICIKINKNGSKIKIINKVNNSKKLFKFNINSSFAKRKLNWTTKISLKKGLQLIQEKKCG